MSPGEDRRPGKAALGFCCWSRNMPKRISYAAPPPGAAHFGTKPSDINCSHVELKDFTCGGGAVVVSGGVSAQGLCVSGHSRSSGAKNPGGGSRKDGTESENEEALPQQVTPRTCTSKWGVDTMGAFQLIVWCKNREPDIHTGGGCSEASEGPWTPSASPSWRRVGRVPCWGPPPPPEQQQNVLCHEEGL